MKVLKKYRSYKGSNLIEMGILIGLISILAIGGINLLGGKINENLGGINEVLTSGVGLTPGGGSAVTGPETFISCDEAYDLGHMETGFYMLKVNGETFRAYCVMQTSGYLAGGWTALMGQFEASPVPWVSGISSDRSEESYFDTSFALSQTQFPQIKEITFGQKSNPIWDASIGARSIHLENGNSLNSLMTEANGYSLSFSGKYDKITNYLPTVYISGHYFNLSSHIEGNGSAMIRDFMFTDIGAVGDRMSYYDNHDRRGSTTGYVYMLFGK